MANDSPASPIRIGISTCLLGENVRYDGGHRRDRFLTDTVGRFVEWVPVCPEVEIGLGTPREPIRLLRAGAKTRLVDVESGTDLTERMRAYARHRTEELAGAGVCGFVLKANSPSCGPDRVKVCDSRERLRPTGRGMFAQSLMERLPYLPIEEEERLADPTLRDNFIERIFAYRRLRDCFAGRWTVHQLVQFHTAQKLALMSHSPTAYTALGRLVAAAQSLDRAQVGDRYQSTFMAALARPATPGRHANVLHHVLGYFKTSLDDASRAELAASVDEYRNGLVPLIVPIALVRHHARRMGVSYLVGQAYLNPHPVELMLRSHA